MRLLKSNPDGSFSVSWFNGDRVPRYAILSHRWEEDDQEVTLEDLSNGAARDKRGYRKIQFCGDQAKIDGLDYFWVDSCCIDKRSSAELSESVNSMFRWYQEAARCYVYLSDVATVGDSKAFVRSIWFTRGWTLQELLAPKSVEFFGVDKNRLGDKNSLESLIREATGIAPDALRGTRLSRFSLNERLGWMKNRKTTISEDFSYCLLGLLNIQIPLLYGEGVEHAFVRLLEEINRRSSTYIYQQEWSGVKTDLAPLMLAARLGMDIFVKLLLQGGAAVDLKDPDTGMTPLSLAAQRGHEDVVKLLLEAKADVNSTDNTGWSPLFFATDGKHQAIVSLLLDATASVNWTSKSHWSPLLLAAKRGNESIVKRLLEAKADTNIKVQYRYFDQHYYATPLSLAVERGNGPIAKLLLDANAEVNVRVDHRYNGKKYHATPLSIAVKRDDEFLVRLILEANAEVNVEFEGLRDREKYRKTPLSMAVEHGNDGIVKLLLAKNANIDAKIGYYDGHGSYSMGTSLSLAAEQGYESIVMVLLDANADANTQIKYYIRGGGGGSGGLWVDGTLLCCAAENDFESIVKLLLEANSDMNTKTGNRYGFLMFAKGTPLCRATERGYVSIVKRLLNANADANIKFCYRSEYKGAYQTPLQIAVKQRHLDIVKLIEAKKHENKLERRKESSFKKLLF